jgi:hypothetical protein
MLASNTASCSAGERRSNSSAVHTLSATRRGYRVDVEGSEIAWLLSQGELACRRSHERSHRCPAIHFATRAHHSAPAGTQRSGADR